MDFETENRVLLTDVSKNFKKPDGKLYIFFKFKVCIKLFEYPFKKNVPIMSDLRLKTCLLYLYCVISISSKIVMFEYFRP